MNTNDKFLIIDSRPYGLFSIFLHTIDNIKWARDNGYIPVVRWGPGRRDPNCGRGGVMEYFETKDPTVLDKNNFLKESTPASYNNTPGMKHCQNLYWSKEGWNGSTNPWNYYFESLNSHTVSEAEKSTNDVADIFMVGELDDDLENKFLVKSICTYEPLALWEILGSDFEKPHRTAVFKVIDDNIKIRKETSIKIENFHKEHFPKDQKVMAVHVRGTDKKLEYPHKALPISAYLSAIKSYLDNTSDKVSLYVASDNNEAIGEIISNFNKEVEKVIVYPSVRMPKYFSKDPICLTSAAGPAHGEEVLIETKLLSRCDHIICTDSNVAASAIYMNPEMTVDYLNRSYGKEG